MLGSTTEIIFIPDDAGVPSIIIAPPSDDPLNNVIACDPTTPSPFASFTGRMFALGDHLIDGRQPAHRPAHSVAALD